MRKIAWREYVLVKILITFALIGRAALLTSTFSNPGSSLQALSLGALDRAVTLRTRLKHNLPHVRVFITGNVPSLGEWRQPVEMQATETRGDWQISFPANRAEVGVINAVVFKVILIILVVQQSQVIFICYKNY
jgi:hypothetical protein